MSTTEERQAKLDEYKVAEAKTNTSRAQLDADTAAEVAAVQKTSESRAAWIADLTDQHRIDDEFDALNAEHEPPALPE